LKRLDVYSPGTWVLFDSDEIYLLFDSKVALIWEKTAHIKYWSDFSNLFSCGEY
jgi:hypothetical protein